MHADSYHMTLSTKNKKNNNDIPESTLKAKNKHHVQGSAPGEKIG